VKQIPDGYVEVRPGEYERPKRVVRSIESNVEFPEPPSADQKLYGFNVVKRMRQGEKPPNKLESDWRSYMEEEQPGVKFRAQSIRFRLANGAWYKPDLMAWLNMRVVCWETKGPKQGKNVDRGILTIKFAATAWPEVLFILVWRDSGGWHQQEVLP
jgi:hypothetical protein